MTSILVITAAICFAWAIREASYTKPRNKRTHRLGALMALNGTVRRMN